MRDPDIIPLSLTFVGIEIQYVNRLIKRCKCDCHSLIVLDENLIFFELFHGYNRLNDVVLIVVTFGDWRYADHRLTHSDKRIDPCFR